MIGTPNIEEANQRIEELQLRINNLVSANSIILQECQSVANVSFGDEKSSITFASAAIQKIAVASSASNSFMQNKMAEDKTVEEAKKKAKQKAIEDAKKKELDEKPQVRNETEESCPAEE